MRSRVRELADCGAAGGYHSAVAALKPIPDATWARLAALEQRCRFCMWRERQWLIPGAGATRVWSGVGGPPSPHRRVWRVRVFLAGSVATQDMIDAAEPHLADGLEAAIAEAERRGWHAPISGAEACVRA